MVDSLDDLRRAALPSGGVEARLRYAEALAQTGVTDELLDVLRPVAGTSPRARRLLAELPAWRHSQGDAGHTEFGDVRPLASSPRLRWLHRGRTDFQSFHILASPLGVVLHKGGHTFILDPDTGEVRLEIPVSDPLRAHVVGEVLIIGQEPVFTGYDLWTGTEVFRAPCESLQEMGASEGAFILRGRESIDVWLLPDPTKAPTTRWTFSPASGFYGQRERREPTDRGVLTTRTHVIAWGLRIAGLDKATGVLRWTVDGQAPYADERGLVAVKGAQTIAYDLDGRPLWTNSDFVRVALAPTFVVAASRSAFVPLEDQTKPRPSTELVALDRATGKVQHSLGEHIMVPCCSVARDVIFFTSMFGGAIRAVRVAGDTVWEFPTTTLPNRWVTRLVPYPGRLYGILQDGSVFCLEEGPTPQ